MFHIYILNTHLCTFWYKFSFLQGVLGKVGVGLKRSEVRGQSHFPDCLVLRERGVALTRHVFTPRRPRSFTLTLAPLRLQRQSWWRRWTRKKRGGSQQWDDKLIGRESRRQFGNSSLGPEPKVVAGFHYLLSGKRAEASETGQSARFCHSQPDAVVPLLPSVSTVDLSGLWLIRLWYLASTSCRRNSSVWDGIDHSLKYTYGHHRCRRLLPSDSWGWPEGFGGETRPVC